LTNDFIVFDTSGMRSGTDKLQDAYNVLITAMMAMRFKGNKERSTVICVDEGRVFLQNPQIAAFLMRILMEGRSAGIGLVIAVQQPADLQKANVAEEMKTNINVNVILGGMTPANVGLVTKFFSLDSSTQEKLLELGKGGSCGLRGEVI
jgi:type IV secretory pathway VirB4 component